MEIAQLAGIGMATTALSLVMPVVLARMARSRGLNLIPWAIAGIVPWLNLLSALALALIPARGTVA